MKKYKVNGKIIDAKTELEAIKKYNDSTKDIDYNLENQIAKEKWTGKTIDEISSLLKKYGFNRKINEYNLSDNIRKISLKNSNEDIITLKYDIRYNKIKEAELNYKVLDSIKDSLDESETEVVEDAIYWVKKSGKELTINNILKQIDEDMKGFLGGNQSRIIEYLKNEKHIKDSVKDDLKYKVGTWLVVDYDAMNRPSWHGKPNWKIEDILDRDEKVYMIASGNLKQAISERDIDKFMSVNDSKVKDAQVLIRYNTNAQANEAIRILKRKGINADLQFDTTISIHNAKGSDVDYAYENTEGIAENQKFYGVNDSKQYIQKGLIEFVVNDTHKAYTFGSARGYNESYDKKGLEQHLKLTEESLDYVNNLERQGFRQDKDKAYLKDANIDILNKLIVEEEKAINDYKSAIENDPDEYASSVYKHILNEEIEHLEELKNLIKGE